MAILPAFIGYLPISRIFLSFQPEIRPFDRGNEK
jgi:hypothetical protein